MTQEKEVQVDIQLTEIYGLLCNKCKVKLERLVEKKITRQLSRKILENR